MKKLVFDVGGSAIKYALMDNDANIYDKGSVVTPMDTFEHFLDVLKGVYEKYQDQIDGIAMSVPGTIDNEKGMIYAPGALTYNANQNLREAIHTFCNLPVAMENDGKSAALAECWKGNLSDYEDGIVIVVGTGLGGGIIKDKKLWKGQHLFAGEFSFVSLGTKVGFDGDIWAMKGSTSALIMETAQRKQVDPSTLNGVKIFEMIQQDDEDAKAALASVAKALAVGIYNLQCILDMSKVLIGGGVSKQPLFVEAIRQELDKIYGNLPFPIPHAQVETCKFYNDANLMGALYNYMITYGKE